MPTPTKSVEVVHEEQVAAPPTSAECQVLAKHIVQVTVSERPADQQISEAEQDHIITAMACDGVTREIYDCAMAASASTAMAACDQRRLSNSTSNSSVAPGGITPPAPR